MAAVGLPTPPPPQQQQEDAAATQFLLNAVLKFGPRTQILTDRESNFLSDLINNTRWILTLKQIQIHSFIHSFTHSLFHYKSMRITFDWMWLPST
jgi:hypothetical protein